MLTAVFFIVDFFAIRLLQGRLATVYKSKGKILGRDHYPDCFTMFMAGGGLKSGISYGSSTPLGFKVAENKVHVHDLQATVLHLLGFDHEKLAYHFQGRDFRLTDVHGHVVKDILS